MTTKKRAIIASIVIVLTYAIAWPFAANGYGYMGYFGLHNGPSYWYWNDTRYYYEKSARSGSVSGTSSRGGGPGQGK